MASGEASLEYRNWVIIGPESVDAAQAALAAGEQDRLWQFVEAFYAAQQAENSGYVTDDFLLGIAEEAGVPDIEQWEGDRQDPGLEAELRETSQEAQQLGLTGTPSIVVEGSDGQQQVVTDLTAEGIQTAIDEASAG
ncbi:MAG: DsbA family protein [Solirubrobacterales bacterium]|nr:DsbA family protein [Solirubrobacterales bacterium]